MRKIAVFLILILFTVFCVGCTTLDTLDLSGTYYLYRQDAYKAESFVTVDSYSWSGSGNLQYLPERTIASGIGNATLNRYWREEWNGLKLINNNLRIGRGNYLIAAALYQNRLDPEIRDAKGNRLPDPEYVSSYYHYPYPDLDLTDLGWEEQTIRQTGTETYHFTEPVSGKLFRLDGSYQADFRVLRDIFTHSGTGGKRSRHELYFVDFAAELKVAFHQYLRGTTQLSTASGKKLEINLSIFDRNLDGEFNQSDYIFLTYPAALFPSPACTLTLPFAEAVSIGKENTRARGRKNTHTKTLYTLSLFPPGPAPFIPENFPKAAAVFPGASGILLLKEDGSLYLWEQQYPAGDKAQQISAGVIIYVGKGYKTASAGDGFYLVVQNDGTVKSWGENLHGRLGAGTELTPRRPVAVVGLNEVTAVSAGKYHALALKADGTVWAWGKNTYGVLGNGTVAPSFTPVQVKGLSEVTQIIAGERFSLAVKADGSIWFWGTDRWLRAQDGKHKSTLPLPVASVSQVRKIAAGKGHFLALRDDGTLWAWGENAHGQLGDGTKTNRALPIQILSGVKEIAASGNHSLAVKEDGTVWGWGDCRNLSGEDPGGDLIAPQPITGLSGIKSVGAGDGYCVAVDEEHSVWLWGDTPVVRRASPYILTIKALKENHPNLQ